MINTPVSPPAIPANDNPGRFQSAAAALHELCRLRMGLLAKDMSAGYSIGQWRRRNQALRELDEGIALCLRYL